MGIRSISRRLGARIGDMSLHGDLLRQARHLAAKEPRRPLQASLRRAVSAAYYSLFHLLVDEAVNRMIRREGALSLKVLLEMCREDGVKSRT